MGFVCPAWLPLPWVEQRGDLLPWAPLDLHLTGDRNPFFVGCVTYYLPKVFSRMALADGVNGMFWHLTFYALPGHFCGKALVCHCCPLRAWVSVCCRPRSLFTLAFFAPCPRKKTLRVPQKGRNWGENVLPARLSTCII